MSRNRKSLSPEIKKMIKAQQDNSCALCGAYFYPSDLEIHHIHYISRGGNNDRKNLIGLCRTCHGRVHFQKGKQTPWLIRYNEKLLNFSHRYQNPNLQMEMNM